MRASRDWMRSSRVTMRWPLSLAQFAQPASMPDRWFSKASKRAAMNVWRLRIMVRVSSSVTTTLLRRSVSRRSIGRTGDGAPDCRASNEDAAATPTSVGAARRQYRRSVRSFDHLELVRHHQVGVTQVLVALVLVRAPATRIRDVAQWAEPTGDQLPGQLQSDVGLPDGVLQVLV